MKRTRILGGLLAASAVIVAAVVLSLPALARQDNGPAPAYAQPAKDLDGVVTRILTPAVAKDAPQPTAEVAPVPDRALMFEIAGAMNAATGNLNIPVLAPSEKKPADSKEVSVDDLIARLAELKAKEAELTELLRTKLQMQQIGLKKLEKLGVTIEKENAGPGTTSPLPGTVASPPSAN